MALDLDYSRRNKKARQLTESEKERLEEFVDAIHYSARYSDDDYEYRHVGTLKLLWEEEWRGLGITQSLGWEHYEVHEPEPHILLFKWSVCLSVLSIGLSVYLSSCLSV
ncbi:Cyclin-dependent kinases regulatory subunit [Cryomyces minteri]|uniref:Cyclin-dependent kinases regulatory subunit n=1 Tax=Cryomyces minteri TaxID=331657 RepID=A0A4V6WL24_9PEZI|nr:Cyclin-dependent kinases regulatory subunit [Cryomyces minteri]